MKLNRLFEITMILLNRGGVTAGQLAERFGVSVRTIYRDIDELSGAGVPVYANRGAGGGISLLPGYTVDKALLSQSERDDVLLALKTLEATRYPSAGAALEKIGAAFQNGREKDEHDWIDIYFQPWQTSPDENGRFDTVKNAILERRVIEFDYVNANGGKSRRSAEPLKLVYYANSFYLNAFCRLRGEVRQFRVSRMKNITVGHEHFEPRTDGSGDFLSGDSRPAAFLRLKFAPQALWRVYDYFGEDYITKNDDGSATVEVCWPEDEWVYSYILSYGGACEVLEPANIREIVKGRLKLALAQYENGKEWSL